MRTRDQQKQRVYDAESKAARDCGTSKVGQTIPNGELQGWVDKVLARRAVRSRWPDDSVEVVLKRGGTAYGYRYGGAGRYQHRITVPVFARNPWVLLHEIAHCLAPDTAHHGPEYAGVYLFLVRTVLGADAGKALLARFREKPVVRHNTKGIPAVRAVPSLAAVAAEKRRTRQPSRAQLQAAAVVIRAAARDGAFGPAGSKPRAHALATARGLEARYVEVLHAAAADWYSDVEEA